MFVGSPYCLSLSCSIALVSSQDPSISVMFKQGWQNLSLFDYSASGIERQRELLWDCGGVDLRVADARDLGDCYEDDSFDAIFEKGAMDAIFLGGEGCAEVAAAEFERVLRPGGTFISASGVVPPDVREVRKPK